MKLYKHYSFDLWLTLIKSNPLFKKQRALLFYNEFNAQKKTLAEVENIFRQVDLMCNAINEKSGKNIDSDEMYLMVLSQLNNYSFSFTDLDVEELYNRIETLFFDLTPTAYDVQTIDALADLKQKSKATFCIISNTAFIKGSTLKRVLNNLKIAQYFEFQIYSDEVGFSKPNTKIFELMIQATKEQHRQTDIELNDILHVGDNLNADGKGAQNMGIDFLQINSNENTILNLLN